MPKRPPRSTQIGTCRVTPSLRVGQYGLGVRRRCHLRQMSTTSPSSVASSLPIAAIPVERFVERLYAPLAWEATVRLGDPAIASRIVERVLHRAWDERDRFATFDALNRHVQDAALAAVTAEADRRRDVTRFDDASNHVPGSLESMSVDAVRRRIGEGRQAKATPPELAAVIQATPIAPAPIAPAPIDPPSVSPAPRPAHKPRLSMSAARVDAPPARPSQPAPRKSAASGLFPAVDSTPSRFTNLQMRVGIGAVVVIALASVVALQANVTRDPQTTALAALADSSGPSHESARGDTKEVTLPDSSIARLGAEGTLQTNSTFGDGARALRIAGPVVLQLKEDSSALAAIQVGEHRFLMAGGTAAFNKDAAGLVTLQVDSGDVILVRDSSRVRIVAGSVVRIGPGTPLTLSRDERDAAFGWRTGRLQLAGASLRTIGAATRQWYDVEVRFPTDRAQADTASIDVPLTSRDSLVVALEQAVRARADVTGNRIALQTVARNTTARRAATSNSGTLRPPGIVIPQIP